MQKTIDINCDIGEGMNNEAILLPLISSCNIACGAHAGDIKTIDTTMQLAVKNRVKIGAHPSYPDRKNFGRKVMDISPSKLQKSLEDQLLLFKQRAEIQQVTINHIKAHGALYNNIAKDKNIAQIFIAAVKNTIGKSYLYVPFQSEIEKLAKQHGIPIKYEVFADRNYNSDLSLVNRSNSNALITKELKSFEHLYFIYTTQKVKTVQGTEVPILFDTFCVHGDHQNAKELLQGIHKRLAKKNITIAKS